MQSEEVQVLYLGRWVSKEHFRAFVYGKDEKKLAKSYDEYCSLISSGLWKAEPWIDDKENENFNENELQDSDSLIEEQLIEVNPESVVVNMKAKRGRKCRNQHKA